PAAADAVPAALTVADDRAERQPGAVPDAVTFGLALDVALASGGPHVGAAGDDARESRSRPYYGCLTNGRTGGLGWPL
ncbi:MAG TPA: hypothetical protein VIN37_02045, partial [Candidatus Limnocylindria bacterium]